MLDLSQWIAGGLILSNQVLAATVLLTSFSLLTYLLTHNLRSPVVRGFCALLAFMLIVYAGDVVLYEVESSAAAIRWRRDNPSPRRAVHPGRRAIRPRSPSGRRG